MIEPIQYWCEQYCKKRKKRKNILHLNFHRDVSGSFSGPVGEVEVLGADVQHVPELVVRDEVVPGRKFEDLLGWPILQVWDKNLAIS